MTQNGQVQRQILPIPDQSYFGLTTYNVKNLDTHYFPIRDLRPPAGHLTY